MPNEPVFGAEDRVATPPGSSGLPKELEGKTPVEIAAYFQNREKTIIKQAREAIQTNDVGRLPGQEPPKPPGTTVRMERPMEGVNPEVVAGATVTLIAAAKTQAAQGKKYWDRLYPDIEKIMNSLSDSNKVDYQYWETAYYNLLGMNRDKFDQEDRDAAANAARIAAERPNPGTESTTPPPPLPSRVTDKVLPGLGISEQQYRTAQDNMEKGIWPLTYDRAGRR